MKFCPIVGEKSFFGGGKSLLSENVILSFLCSLGLNSSRGVHIEKTIMETEVAVSNNAGAPEVSPHSYRDVYWDCLFCGFLGSHRQLVGRWGLFKSIMFLIIWILAILASFTVVGLIFTIPWVIFACTWWLMDLKKLKNHEYTDAEGRPLYAHDDGTYSSRHVCGSLCAVWGNFGIHRLYLGHKKSGYWMLGIGLAALLVTICERVLKKVLGFVLFFVDDDLADSGSDVLSKLIMFVGVPMLLVSSGIGVILLPIYACYFVVSVWAFVDFIRCLFGKFPNACGNPLVSDELELARLRNEHYAQKQSEGIEGTTATPELVYASDLSLDNQVTEQDELISAPQQEKDAILVENNN